MRFTKAPAKVNLTHGTVAIFGVLSLCCQREILLCAWCVLGFGYNGRGGVLKLPQCDGGAGGIAVEFLYVDRAGLAVVEPEADLGEAIEEGFLKVVGVG